MSNYNMDDQFSKDLKLTFTELFEEIYEKTDEEIDEKNYKEIPKSSFYKYFHNNDNTGINDNLKKHLNFDIDAFANHSKLEKYNTMRLQKLLYTLRSIGVKNPLNEECEEFKEPGIFSILGKPYYNNLNTRFDNKKLNPNKHYGDVIDFLIDQLKDGIGREEADKLEEEYAKIDIEWTQVVGKMFYSWKILDEEQYKDKLLELRDIENYIQCSILDKLEPYSPPEYQSEYGVLKSFFNLLMCHRNLCYEADLVQNRYSILEENIDEKYAHDFVIILQLGDMQMNDVDYSKEIKELGLSFELPISIKLDKAVDLLKNGFPNSTNPISEYIWNMITYKQGIDFKDKRTLRKYLDRFGQVYRLLSKYRSDEYRGLASDIYHRDNEENPKIFLADIIVIMQEIIYGDKTKEVEARYYGVGSSYKKSLASLFGNNIDPVVVQAWVNQLENRNAINSGKREMIELKRRIDILLYKLKYIMYSNRTLEDVDLVMSYYCCALGIRLVGIHQMENLLNFTSLCIKHIPELNFIDEIILPEVSGRKAWRYITMLFFQECKDSFYNFWVGVSLALQNFCHCCRSNCSIEDNRCDEKTEQFKQSFYRQLSMGSLESLNVDQIKIDIGIIDGFKIKVPACIAGFHESYFFCCGFEPRHRKLIIFNCHPIVSDDNFNRLREIGFQKLTYDTPDTP